MEIMSWKERAKDVYSQVASDASKKRTSERRERVTFFDTLQRMI